MTRTSTFALATLTVIAAASLTSTGASARGGGGSFAGGPSGSGGHSFGSVSAAGGYAHLPSGIARSSVISRMPVGSRIARSSVIARLSPPAKTGHRIPTTTHISQFPKDPVTVRTPDHNHPKPSLDGVGVAVDIACGDVANDTVGIDSQAVQIAQPTCNCLTKQYLDDGRVLFQDICTRETTLATPVEQSVAY